MSGEKITINRTMVGILALACLGAAAAIFFYQPDIDNGDLWLAGFLRVGLVMCAFWLALPSRHREAAWANVSPTTFVGILLAIIATVRIGARFVLPALIVVIVIGLVLRPRTKQRPRSRD